MGFDCIIRSPLEIYASAHMDYGYLDLRGEGQFYQAVYNCKNEI